MLNARAIALQGIGFTPALVALQGFGLVEAAAGGRRPRRHGIKAEFYTDQTYNLAQLRQDDELATDLITALLTKGFFDVDA